MNGALRGLLGRAMFPLCVGAMAGSAIGIVQRSAEQSGAPTIERGPRGPGHESSPKQLSERASTGRFDQPTSTTIAAHTHYPIDQWRKVPMALLKNYTSVTIDYLLTNPRSGIAQTLKEEYGLTATEVMAVDSAFLNMLESWCEVVSRRLIPIGDGNWSFTIPADSRETIKIQLQATLRAILGSEKAYVAQAIVFKSLNRYLSAPQGALTYNQDSNEWTLTIGDDTAYAFGAADLDAEAPVHKLIQKAKVPKS